jgi:hypothetical protein
MKYPVTLIFLWILIAFTAASPVEPSTMATTNSTFEEKHGCHSQGCEHESASSASKSGCLEALYGAMIISFVALM